MKTSSGPEPAGPAAAAPAVSARGPDAFPSLQRIRRNRPAFFSPNTWRAFAYHWLTLLLAPFGLAYFVLTVSLGASLLITVVGLLIPAAMVTAARSWGALHRGIANALLDVSIPAPPPFIPRSGFFGFLRSGLSDAAGWRALGHMVVGFITSVTAAALSISMLVTGLGCVTHWYWYQFLPAEQDGNGDWHRGGTIAPNLYVDETVFQLAYAAVGLTLTLVVWPALNNGTARLQAALAAGMLGPTPEQERVRDLEARRDSSVHDADNRLQRIERDLHDGTQAQLVAIAMKLGDAKDRLAAANTSSGAGAGPQGEQSGETLHQDLQRLVGSAHGTAKEALSDLRGLARGIRPAVLNDGLDTALESLAGASPIPATVSYTLSARPVPAVEAIAYFSAAELINNAAKHSGATGVDILVTSPPEASGVRLQVRDNGKGGADPARGTGLAGLADRVRTVDGNLRVDSPAGGPTVITVDLPLS